MADFPILNPLFQPALREIAALSAVYFQDALLLQVTTTQDHLYKDGLVVRLSIPQEFGAQQFNQAKGDIAVDSPSTFIMAFAEIQFDPFVIPLSPLQVPLVIPIAEDVQFLNSAVRNVLP